MKYKPRARIVDAAIWDGSNHREMYEFLGGDPKGYMTTSGTNFVIDHDRAEWGLVVKTRGEEVAAHSGNYIVKLGKDNYEVWEEDEFLDYYEPATLYAGDKTPEAGLGVKEVSAEDAASATDISLEFLESLKAEDRLKEATMRDIPDTRDYMTMAEFIENVECGGFTDYDGFGKYATAGKMSDIVVRPSDVPDNLHAEYSHVVWFNK